MRIEIITTRDWTQWLDARRADGLERRLRVGQSPQGVSMRVDGRELLAFCSNDYLGLANHPDIVTALQIGAARWGVGSGAAHLVNGHFEPHDALEFALAEWLRVDRCLLFSTGYMANLAVVGGLVGRGDTVVADKLNHASLVDAAQLSGATLRRYRHGDIDDARRQLMRATGTRMILTDGVFSMDGDVARLADLMALAEEFDAWLVVDDAHGFGVWGEQGRGSLAELGVIDAGVPEYLVQVGTLGKAFGTAGAFVAGASQPVEVLLQRARSYLFTTAQPPALAVATLASLSIVKSGNDLRANWRARVAALKRDLPPGIELMPSDTPIQPILIGDSAEAVKWSARLAESGLWVPAVRPPTVPKGAARLRVTISAAHSTSHVAQLIEALK
ncbi:8-amino-7-oxononanoate synthase [Halothiobacillus neapolitanus]|uniref:8-amino-7-oxononanoate synthase n=1 Tax=Halothiobacillus neapolitanus (strain ATCC 23641 / DSM 15147 / CIP 104769 / NCIMB 8539 / c2) TaxID=555778 RepID=D0KVQ6_HALNC|nr:8-amino-7-oxononanoate synthase [Halothiobacillus neapolitanus]ACX96886.1 8-amino-7-oxononanoate synthase [Halothiobacillus neapolitanus c2]